MDGPEWSQRRKSLNKVFLKSASVSQYSEMFNGVISDLLERWAQASASDAEGAGLLTGLERELYNWSIECECRCRTSHVDIAKTPARS